MSSCCRPLFVRNGANRVRLGGQVHRGCSRWAYRAPPLAAGPGSSDPYGVGLNWLWKYPKPRPILPRDGRSFFPAFIRFPRLRRPLVRLVRGGRVEVNVGAVPVLGEVLQSAIKVFGRELEDAEPEGGGIAAERLARLFSAALGTSGGVLERLEHGDPLNKQGL